MKKKFIFFSLIVLIFVSYFFLSESIGNKGSFLHKVKYSISNSVSEDTKIFVKEKIFVYKYVRILKNQLKNKNLRITKAKKQKADKEIQLENLLIYHGSIPVKKIDKIQKFQIKNKNYTLKKFKTDFLYIGKIQTAIGSSYLDYFDNKLFIISGTGIFGYVDVDKFNNDKFDISIVPSNIKEIVKYDDFYSSTTFGIKDLLIYKNKIYISYTNQVKKDCFNTSILVSDLNLQKLNFENFFTPDLCMNKSYEDFASWSAGGRMFPFKDNEILFTHGEYQIVHQAQDKNNLFGKIISIDINTKKFNMISLGHRNPQGLYYDSSENIIFTTEHGPTGGDEININISPEGEIENYGWPTSSYGVFNETYPLYKSHKDYGFIEPLIQFTPSIAPSEIIKIPFEYNKIKKKQFFVGAMGYDLDEGDMSIHHFILSNDNIILQHNVLPINERIRDIIYVKEVNKIFIFLETSASIGILEAEN